MFIIPRHICEENKHFSIKGYYAISVGQRWLFGMNVMCVSMKSSKNVSKSVHKAFITLVAVAVNILFYCYLSFHITKVDSRVFKEEKLCVGDIVNKHRASRQQLFMYPFARWRFSV